MTAIAIVGAKAHLGRRLSSMRVLLQLGQKNLSQLVPLISFRGLRLSHPPQGLANIGNATKLTLEDKTRTFYS